VTRCKATVAEEREDRRCKRTAVKRGYCQLHRRESVLVNGRWSDEECARCDHRWGNHGQAHPHRCTRKDLGCDCVAFIAHAEEGEA
jgi:hypothetical protein